MKKSELDRAIDGIDAKMQVLLLAKQELVNQKAKAPTRTRKAKAATGEAKA